MAKNYQWRTNAEIISGGYPGEETGVIPPDTGWRTTSATSGGSTAEYYFRDSDTAENANSSRVVVEINETWTVSFDNRNNMTVTLKTIISSIRRDDIRGTVGTLGIGRSMFIRRREDGSLKWQISNDPIGTAHTILGTPVTLDDYTFTLAPGENLTRSSIYFRSNTYGHDSDVPPSTYVDIMWMGTEFKNILPKDYRPGTSLDTNTSIWKSHNRTNGACHVLNGSTWQECRTLDGDSGGQGNPPLMLRQADASSWYNQRLLGKQD